MVNLGENMDSEGEPSTPKRLTNHEDYEGDVSSHSCHINSNAQVRYKDSRTSMPRFANLHESILRRPKRLQKVKLK